MATPPVVTFQFPGVGPAMASEASQNFDDLIKYLTDRNAGTVSWDALSVIGNASIGGTLSVQGTSSVPFIFSGATGAHDILSVKVGSTTLMTIQDDGKVGVGDGAIGAPGLTFISDLDCGLYRIAANNIALSAGGTKCIDILATGVAVLGTTTNNDASAGFVGESVRSQIARASATSAGTSAQWFNITSISLTAGDWLVSGIIGMLANGATVTADSVSTAISINSGNTTTDHVAGDNVIDVTTVVPTAAHDVYTAIPNYRIKVANGTTQTVYMKALMAYSVATPKGFGRISANRIR